MTAASVVFFLLMSFVQRDTGWLEGTVTDRDSGAGVPNVEIVITNSAGGNVLRSQTDASGAFALLGISPGEYELTFRNPLYPDYLLRSVEVPAGCGAVVNVRMD